MRIKAGKIILIITITLLPIALIFLCIGLTGDYWMQFTSNGVISDMHFSLYKVCRTTLTKEVCTERNDILKFDSSTTTFIPPIEDGDLDVVLVLIIVAAVLGFIALLVALPLICSKGGGSWICLSVTAALLLILGGLIGIGGLAYFEKIIEDAELSDTYDHAWSSILSWVGILFLLISSALSFVMICMRPKPDYNNQGHVVYATNISSHPSKDYKMDEKPSGHPTYDNRAYEKDYNRDQRDNVRGHQVNGNNRNYNEKDLNRSDRNRGNERDLDRSDRNRGNGRDLDRSDRNRGNEKDLDRSDRNRGYHDKSVRGGYSENNKHYRDENRNNNSRNPGYEHERSSYEHNNRRRTDDRDDGRHDIQPQGRQSKRRIPSYDADGYQMR